MIHCISAESFLLRTYNAQKQKSLEERLILFKECLRNGIVPFIIDEELKMFYYRGLHEWKQERGYLRDTCLAAQDEFKAYLNYFRIPYKKQE